MLFKCIKIGLVGLVGLAIVGGLVFGGDVFSYVRSSAASVRDSVKDAVPIEFELQRARQLLEEIVPELHANIRLIAQEEVEVAELKEDIASSETGLAEERARLGKLSSLLESGVSYYVVSERSYARESVKEELGRRFERYKEAEIILAGSRCGRPWTCSKRPAPARRCSPARSRPWPASIGW
jgi:hypothetical protein